MMTRRLAADYIALFDKLQELFGDFAAREIISDFEPAVWKAVRTCFPGVRHLGCTFHWAQAVVKTCKRLQLFRFNGEKKRTIYKILRLPYLPVAEIHRLFESMWAACTDDMRPLFEYLSRVWVNGRWKPECWCMYQRSIRTNNYQEGNHVKLNMNVGPNVRERKFILIITVN